MYIVRAQVVEVDVERTPADVLAQVHQAPGPRVDCVYGIVLGAGGKHEVAVGPDSRRVVSQDHLPQIAVLSRLKYNADNR